MTRILVQSTSLSMALKKFLLTSGVALVMAVSTCAFAQLTISNSTPFSANAGTVVSTNGGIVVNSTNVNFNNVNLVLTGTGAQALINNTANEVRLNELELNGSGVKSITNGAWGISNTFTLTLGNLVVGSGNNAALTYYGTTDLAVTNANSYVEGRLFTEVSGIGPRSFPIGNAAGFFPIVLENVSDVGTRLGLEVIQGSPNLDSKIPRGVDEIFNEHYWELITFSANNPAFSGSLVSLSLNGTQNFLGERLVIEEDTDGNVTNLGGASRPDFVIGTAPATSKASLFALGRLDVIELKIFDLISPNNDQKNETIRIENIEAFPENTVTLLDRWGVKVKSWTNFVNYTESKPDQSDFDFASLGEGNYVCAIEYTDGTGSKVKKSGMITVLK